MAFQPVPTYASPVDVDSRTGQFAFSPVWLSWFLTLSEGGLSSTIQHNQLLGLQGGETGQYYHLTETEYQNVNIRDLGLPFPLIVASSPFTYENTDTFDLDVIITGSVSNVSFSRDNITYYTVGFTQGIVRLSPGDCVQVTYSGVVPTMIAVPR
jgi:hypothetical protein